MDEAESSRYYRSQVDAELIDAGLGFIDKIKARLLPWTVSKHVYVALYSYRKILEHEPLSMMPKVYLNFLELYI